MSEQVTIVKCRCGSSVCNTYGLSDGIFPQGAGWPKHRAEQIAQSINAYDADQAKIKALVEAINEAVRLLDDHVDNALDAIIVLRAALRLVEGKEGQD